MPTRGPRYMARNFAMFKDYLSGDYSQDDLATKYGLSQSRVSVILTRFKNHEDPENVRLVKSEIAAILGDLVARHADLAMPERYPPLLDKDGRPLRDENQQIIRDPSAAFGAAKILLKALERTSAFYGLDAPSRADVSTTVRYTYEGIDPEEV